MPDPVMPVMREPAIVRSYGRELRSYGGYGMIRDTKLRSYGATEGTELRRVRYATELRSHGATEGSTELRRGYGAT